MTDFTSDRKTIPYSTDKVYHVLSNLSNLEKIINKLTQDKVTDITVEQDKATFSISPLGKVNLFIEKKEPPTTIKLGMSGIPAKASLDIYLTKVEENITQLNITLHAALNPILKGMLSKPIQEGIDKMAEALAGLPYDKI